MPNTPLTISKKMKLHAHRCFRALGFDIVRTHPVSGNDPVVGSFPPHTEYSIVGSPQNFFIHDGYRHRTEAIHWDDTENKDEWQDEVYKFAREVFVQQNLRAVADVGCGSAYKLLKYFGDGGVIGLDVAETCVWLRKRYPHSTWIELDFRNPRPVQAELIIAADVIEHLPNPDDLISYLLAVNPRYIVLSTPDRNLLRAGTHNGPPRNPAHAREWSFVQFEAYIARRFQVLEHFISNSAQGTQCVLCAPR